MRKQLVPAVGILALAATKVSAQLVYEPFDYGTASVNTNLGHTSTGTPDPFSGYLNPMVGAQWFDGNTGIGTGTPFELTVQSGNLGPNYTTALAPATGNLANWNNASSTAARSARLAVAPVGITSGTTYYSFTFRITDLGQVPQNASGGFFAGFGNEIGTTTANIGTTGARMHIRRDAVDSTKFNVGIKSNTNTNTLGITYDYLQDPTQPAGTAKQYSVGDDIFVVGSYTINGGAGDDVSALWVNPDASSFGAGTAPARGQGISGLDDMQVAGGNDIGSVSSILLRQGNTAVPAGMNLDEVRVDTTWAGVTAPKGTSWTGAPGASWTGGGNWDTATEPGGGASFVNFNSGTGGAVNIDSPKTVGTLNIKNTNSYDFTGSTLTLDGGAGGQGNINVYAVMSPTGGPPSGSFSNSSHTVSAALSLATNSAANIALGQTLSVSSVISGSGTSLSKNGGGTLLLTNNANTFSGGLNVNNGIVGFVADGSLGAAGAPISLARGTLRFDNAAASIAAGRTITINGPANTTGVGILDTNGLSVTVDALITGRSLTKQGNGTLTLSAANTHTGNFVTGGTLAINDDTNLGTVPASPNLNITLSNGGAIKMLSATAAPNANRIINLGTGGGIIDTNGFNATLSQRIFGGGGLGKRGAGTLTLTTTGTGNDYQARTTLSGGILEAGASNLLGNDNVNNGLLFNGGTFRATASFASVNRGIAVTSVGGTIDTQANNLTFGGALTGTGTLTKVGSGLVRVPSIDTGGLNVTDGVIRTSPRTGTPNLAASNKPVYVNGALSISATGALDTQDQDLVVTYGTNPSTFADVKSLVLSGFGAPAGGITSSTSNGSQILGLFDNALIGATEWPGGSGHTISTNSVVGKYTYFGDVNFDGQVTGDDYTIIDSNLNTTPPVGLEWLSGDANLDGIVTGDDYTTIDSNLGLGTTNPLSPSSVGGGLTPSSLSAVPEPGSLSVLALGAASLLARRRRRK